MKLQLKVVPGSSRAGIAGWLGEALRVRVAEPPERGKANAAGEELLAKALGLPPDGVRVVAGHGSARKLVELSGLPEAELRSRIAKLGRE